MNTDKEHDFDSNLDQLLTEMNDLIKRKKISNKEYKLIRMKIAEFLNKDYD